MYLPFICIVPWFFLPSHLCRSCYCWWVSEPGFNFRGLLESAQSKMLCYLGCKNRTISFSFFLKIRIYLFLKAELQKEKEREREGEKPFHLLVHCLNGCKKQSQTRQNLGAWNNLGLPCGLRGQILDPPYVALPGLFSAELVQKCSSLVLNR